MPIAFRSFSFVIVLALAFPVGCSRPGPTETDASTKSGVADVDFGKTKAGGRSEDATASVPSTNDDPAAAFGRLVADVVAGRTAKVVEAVPQSIRDDIGRRWRESVLSVDSSTRRDAAAAVATFADVLARKRQFVLESDRIELEGAAAEFVKRRIEAIARFVASVARWPGWSGDGRDIDVAAMLETVMKAIAAEPALRDELRSLRFETRMREGSDAIVRIQNANHAESFDLPVTLVDGYWVPKRIVELSSGSVRTSRDESSAVDDESRVNSLQRLTQQLREMAATLDGVDTQQEFDAQADRAAALLMASAGESVEAVRPVGDEELATLHVLGKITADEKDRLLWSFVAQTDSPGSGLAEAADRTDGDGMNVTIGPVADVEKFANRLPGVTIERIDRETRTITVRIGEP